MVIPLPNGIIRKLTIWFWVCKMTPGFGETGSVVSRGILKVGVPPKITHLYHFYRGVLKWKKGTKTNHPVMDDHDLVS